MSLRGTNGKGTEEQERPELEGYCEVRCTQTNVQNQEAAEETLTLWSHEALLFLYPETLVLCLLGSCDSMRMRVGV